MADGDGEPTEPSDSDSSAGDGADGSADETAAVTDGDEPGEEEGAATSADEIDGNTAEETDGNSAEGTDGNSAEETDDKSAEKTDGNSAEETDDKSAEETDGNSAEEATEATDNDDATDDPTTTDGGTFEGAPDDEEMPLTEHIEEMFKRLAAVIVVMGGVSLIIFPVAPDLINWLWYSFLPGNPESCVNGADTTACPRVYHPLGLLFARIKVASLVGFVLALPVFVYQTYLFMRPGLYPHERRYYLAAVPTSLLLAFVGLAFAYFLVLPFIFTYFLFYSEDVAEIAFGLTETFDLILLMLGLFAAIFQIPLFIMLAIMMGVTTRRWLEEKRYYFWLGFAGFAFLFSPDPTGMAPFMVGITMVALYELTLLLLRWAGR